MAGWTGTSPFSHPITCRPRRTWSSRGREVKTTMGVVKKLATSPLTRRVAAAILLGLAEHLRDVMRQGR